MKKSLRCGECGSKDTAYQNVKGKFFPFESFNKVKLSTDLDLCQCNKCGSTILAPGDAERLDLALELTIKNSVAEYIENIVKKTSWKQAEMADYIGFTPVYISELKKGRKVPEFKTFNYFKILSECPDAIGVVVEDDPRCTQKHYQVNFLTNKPEISQSTVDCYPIPAGLVNEITEAFKDEKREAAAESNDYGYALAA